MKTYWKDIRRSVTGTLGRFCSITLLMFLGSFALVGLKSTIPDMEALGQAFFKDNRTMDLSVMADYGLTKDDQAELAQLKGAEIAYGYLADTTISGSHKAVRLYSKGSGSSISQYKRIKGKLPQAKGEIALTAAYQSDYKIGDRFTIETDNKSVSQKSFTVTGFVYSSEIIAKDQLGNSTAGDGQLDGYGLVLPEVFDSDVYGVARIRFHDLASLNPFSDRYEKKIAQKTEAVEKLLADNDEKRLADLRAEAKKKIDSAQTEISRGETAVKTQENQLEQISAYMTPQEKAAYQKKIDEAKSKIRNSRSKLSEAKEAAAALRTADYHVYTRSSLPVGTGYMSLTASMSGIETVSNIFPIVLYFVAALVVFTTMTRFVDEERLNSGLFQALGYSSRHIIRKFLIYGLAAGLTGTVLGSLAGTYFLPSVISRTSMGRLILGEIKPVFHWEYISLAICLMLISAILPAFLIARKELEDTPSQLLLPKPPPAGSKIFLERIGFIWQRLSFTHKVTVRNIFRYKQRMLMTVFGVAGSVTLLFAGLGIQSSIGGVVPSQYEKSMTYDLLVSEKASVSQAEKAAIDKLLTDGRIKEEEAIHYETASQKIAGQTEEQSVNVMAAEGDHFGRMLRLYSSKGDRIKLSDKGAVLSKKLARLYGVRAGDYFTYRDSSGRTYRLKAAAISNIYAGHYIFMNQAYYEKSFGRKMTAKAHLIEAKTSVAESLSGLAHDFLKLSGVVGAVQNKALADTLRTVVRSLNSVMLILVILSISLAMVILYNLTAINVAERIRELSTIKVLGFHSKEVTLYIYRETILLSLVGIVLGLVSGFGLHRLIIDQMGGDSNTNITFEPQVGFLVYLVPVVAVISILILLGWVVNRRLKRLDMLEALKSVD